MALQKTLKISALCTSAIIYSAYYLNTYNSRKMRPFEEEKARCLSRSIEERTANGALPIDDIPTWTTFFTENRERLKDLPVEQYASEYNVKLRKVDEAVNKRISLWRGDLTKLAIDAIVNAANERLRGGGGVDGAIHRAAGGWLLTECKEYKGCEAGHSEITAGYELPAKYVIHAVGPRGEKPEVLRSTYQSALKRAEENQLRTIAFPCISTGIFGYPQEKAAVEVLGLLRSYLEKNPDDIDRVILCVFLDKDVEIYETLMQIFFPVEETSNL